jgi:hypothetical protein
VKLGVERGGEVRGSAPAVGGWTVVRPAVVAGQAREERRSLEVEKKGNVSLLMPKLMPHRLSLRNTHKQ